LAPSPGLVFGHGAWNGGTYISEDGSDWSKVSDGNLTDSMNGGHIEVSSTGKVWLLNWDLSSIGGPLRNGRFFYYQKD
jgi:hypothetical protein